jgi:hypothetical protein
MHRQRQEGFSIVEVVIAAAIFMGLVVVISSLAVSGSDAQDLSRRIHKMTEAAQQIADDIRLELVSSARIYGDDADGQALRDMLFLEDAPAPLASARLPRLDVDGPFRRDEAGSEISGNSLLFAYLAWRDRFRCSSGNEHVVDVYRIVHYYLTERDGGPATGRRGGLDLVRFQSEPLADADAVEDIADAAERAEVLLHLLGGTADTDGRERDPVQVVWQRTANPGAAGAFMQIDPDDGSLSASVLSGSDRPDPWGILPAQEGGVRSLLAYRRAAVASNFDLEAPGISRFALADDDAGFPHGFELQLIGPTAARQLLLHLVLMDPTRRGAPAWSAVQTVINAHER